MTSTLNRSKKILVKIENEIDHRRRIYLTRSDNWQNSKRGIEYRDKSYDLVCSIDYLKHVIICLENFVKM